jgi:hypothetical protein
LNELWEKFHHPKQTPQKRMARLVIEVDNKHAMSPGFPRAAEMCGYLCCHTTANNHVLADNNIGFYGRTILKFLQDELTDIQ